MSEPSVTSRQSLRKSLRQARRALSDDAQQLAAQALQQRLSEYLPPHTKQLAGYLASDGEISLLPTLSWCHQRGILTSLPVIHPFTGKHLLFQHFTHDTAMTRNRFNIEEPALDSTAIIELTAHDCLLMPLVGFDAKGNRLGMGGGFYDRTLAPLQQLRDGTPRPLLIGVAHDCQQVPVLPIEPWDIPLDVIITPTQCIEL